MIGLIKLALLLAVYSIAAAYIIFMLWIASFPLRLLALMLKIF